MPSKEIHVPALGDFKDVAVIDVLVKSGDAVQVDTPLLTLETEKATMDVPSTEAGTIQTMHVQKGSKVSAGTLIATIAAAGAAEQPAKTQTPPVSRDVRPSAPAAPAAPTASSAAPAVRAVPTASAAPANVAKAAAPALPKIDERSFALAHASPSVRRFARELGVDPGRIKGSGQKSRVTEEDVKAFVKSLMTPAAAPSPTSSAGASAAGAARPAGTASSAAPAAAAAGLPRVNVPPDFGVFGAVEVRPLSRVQRISGPRLHASWVNLPHVTQFEEADITELEALREQLKSKAEAAGIKLTPLAFIVRACVKALQQFPLFNTSLDASGQNLVYKKYIHIGFAADTPNGLLVPVIHDADHKDIYEIARVLGELSAKARAGKLTNAEMQGGSFTISSLGGIGGTAFTPIINAPEVAILGVSRSSYKPIYRDGAFVPRLMLPLSLSYDHRVVDGANAARFASYLAGVMARPHDLIEAVL